MRLKCVYIPFLGDVIFCCEVSSSKGTCQFFGDRVVRPICVIDILNSWEVNCMINYALCSLSIVCV